MEKTDNKRFLLHVASSVRRCGYQMCPGGPILYGVDTFGTYTGNYRDPEVAWRQS